MLKNGWLNEFAYLILGVLIAGFLCTHSPNLEYDIDPSYLLFGPSRPPLYPIFIWLFRWAGPYQFFLIMWLQGVLLFSALLYARNWLRKNLQISDFLIFMVCLLVVLTIGFHFQIWFIQSEGLSFPLFIVTFFVLIECFEKFNLKKIFYLAVLVSLLVLTRLQFYYFYLVFVLLCGWYLWQRTSMQKASLAVLILVGSVCATTVVDHGYHYLKHGNFSGGSYSGLMFLVQTLFLADNNAADYFENPTEKSYVQAMINQRNAQGLNQDASLITSLKPSYLQYAYQSYSKNYLVLQKIIDITFNTSVENTLETASIYKANAAAMNINKVLMLHEAKKNLIFLLWKFVQCMGNVPLFLFYLIILLTIPFRIMTDKILYPNLSLIFVATITILTFGNAAIIALCNPDIPVYFCYSQFMFYCLAAFLINKTFIHHHANMEFQCK